MLQLCEFDFPFLQWCILVLPTSTAFVFVCDAVFVLVPVGRGSALRHRTGKLTSRVPVTERVVTASEGYVMIRMKRRTQCHISL